MINKNNFANNVFYSYIRDTKNTELVSITEHRVISLPSIVTTIKNLLTVKLKVPDTCSRFIGVSTLRSLISSMT